MPNAATQYLDRTNHQLALEELATQEATSDGTQASPDFKLLLALRDKYVHAADGDMQPLGAG